MQVACQFIRCSQYCEVEGTAFHSGVYPACTCNCTDSFYGIRCQIPVYVTPTSTPTASSESSATPSIKPTPTITDPATKTDTSVPTPTVSATITPVEILPVTVTPTSTPSLESSPTVSLDPTNTKSLEPTSTGSVTPSAAASTVTGSPSATSTHDITATKTHEPTPTASLTSVGTSTNSATPSTDVTATGSPSASSSPEVSPTLSLEPTPTASLEATTTDTSVPTPTGSVTPSAAASTKTGSPSATPTPDNTATNSHQPTRTASASIKSTETASSCKTASLGTASASLAMTNSLYLTKTYSGVCTSPPDINDTTTTSIIATFVDAVVLCAGVDSTPATPLSAAENGAAYDQVAIVGADSLLGGTRLYDAVSNVSMWVWNAPSVHQREIFWVLPSDDASGVGYAPSGAFASWSTNIDISSGDNLTYPLLETSKWQVLSPNSSTVNCVICEQEACSSACNAEGTDSFTGTWWPSCTCTCKPGWTGIACTRQVAVYPITTPFASTEEIVAFCASKGGYLAQPTSLAEEDAILRAVTTTDGTDFAKPVAIGATANDTTQTYCYRDGRLDGECVTNDYGDGVPTTPTTTPVTVLRPLSFSTGRWAASSPNGVVQVACQFIMCSQYCVADNTASSSGNYPSCVCNCVEGFTGSRCHLVADNDTATPTPDNNNTNTSTDPATTTTAPATTASQIFQVASPIITGVVAVLFFLLSDGSIEIQCMIIILGSMCATEGDRDLTVWIKYFISPAMDWGSFWVIVCNVCIAVGFTLLHFIIMMIVYVYRNRRQQKQQQHNNDPDAANKQPTNNTTTTTTSPYQEHYCHVHNHSDNNTKWGTLLRAAATVLFPGLSLMMCRFMYIGVACATFDLLRGERSITILGIVYLIALPVFEFYLLVRRIAIGYVPYKTLGCSPKYTWLGWIYPSGVWGPVSETSRFIGVVGGYRVGFKFATLLHYLMAIVITLFLCALHGSIPCEYAFAIMAIFLFVIGVVYLLLHPCRLLVYCLLTGVCLISIALLCVVEAVGAAGAGGGGTGVENAKMAFVYLAIITSLLRSIVSIIVFIIEWRWARNYRRGEYTETAMEDRRKSGADSCPQCRGPVTATTTTPSTSNSGNPSTTTATTSSTKTASTSSAPSNGRHAFICDLDELSIFRTAIDRQQQHQQPPKSQHDDAAVDTHNNNYSDVDGDDEEMKTNADGGAYSPRGGDNDDDVAASPASGKRPKTAPANRGEEGGGNRNAMRPKSAPSPTNNNTDRAFVQAPPPSDSEFQQPSAAAVPLEVTDIYEDDYAAKSNNNNDDVPQEQAASLAPPLTHTDSTTTANTRPQFDMVAPPPSDDPFASGADDAFSAATPPIQPTDTADNYIDTPSPGMRNVTLSANPADTSVVVNDISSLNASASLGTSSRRVRHIHGDPSPGVGGGAAALPPPTSVSNNNTPKSSTTGTSPRGGGGGGGGVAVNPFARVPDQAEDNDDRAKSRSSAARSRSRQRSMVKFSPAFDDPHDRTAPTRARSAPRGGGGDGSTYSLSEMNLSTNARSQRRPRSMSQSGMPRFFDANSTSGQYVLDLREHGSVPEMSLLRSTRFGQDDFDFTHNFKK